jgi:hypothetical protein
MIKPTYAIVFAGKENLFKYRNKITSTSFEGNNNFQKFQTFSKENNSIENIIKNSNVFMKGINKEKDKEFEKDFNIKTKSIKKNEIDNNNKIKEKLNNNLIKKNKGNEFYLSNKLLNNGSANKKNNNNNNKNSNNYSNSNEKFTYNNDKDNKPIKTEKKNLFSEKEIINWLEDLNIIKPNFLKLEDLPNFCRDGVLFADIINRLEGVIKIK